MLTVCSLAALAAFAQAPPIGDINFYGLRRTSEAAARKALGVKEGERLPPSKGGLEERLEELPGVVLARVEAICCEDGRVLLFVGVEEKGAPHFAFRSPPTGSARLPEAMVEAYRKFLAAAEAAARRGAAAEDLTRGHSLMADPDARELQERFAAFAAGDFPLLRTVLRESSDSEHRAMAAALIGYALNKSEALAELQFAMQDPDETVRASVIRSLTAIAVLAALHPEQELKVSPTWLVEMLNSIALSDRAKATDALVTLTERNPEALQQIRERALASVLEMARWKTLRYALPAFILAGRLAGMSEKDVEETWIGGRRETVLDPLERRK